MTSLEFYHHPDPTEVTIGEPDQWGTGKTKAAERENIWNPRPASWNYLGKPIEQYYTLTDLKLSNVRLNDQLLTKPQESEMGKITINKPFPAEHPFSSHTPRFAVFPKFAEAPEEEKRGYRAREEMPKNHEMPANPYDVQIIAKTKGNPFRWEHQTVPPESLKRSLTWHGDTYDQLVKSPWGGTQSYYPSAPKTFVPNLDKRDNSRCINGDMEIAPRTANTLKNLERDQWQTTYDLNHTGLGSSGPMQLDNYDEKHTNKLITGMQDDNLFPRSVKTFDPPRPFEGRIARSITPRPRPQTSYPDGIENPYYARKLTRSEIEEDRLLNGREYINLPEGGNGNRWKEMEYTFQADTNLDLLHSRQMAGRTEEEQEEENEEQRYLDKLKDEQDDVYQQIEASNRFNLLESQKPNHELKALHHKLDNVSSKTEPYVFYDHEGKYQRERAGMYKTSYDPYQLQYSMNKLEKSGPELMDTHRSHVNALNNNTQLNETMGDAIRWSRTLGGGSFGTVPQYHNQPSQFEAIQPFDDTKTLQKRSIQPGVDTSDIRTQENGITLKESTYGDSYNTKKFLQENTLMRRARSEPFLLMSNENSSLDNVRLATTSTRLSKSGKSVQFNDKITVASGAGSEPIRLSRAHITSPKKERPIESPRMITNGMSRDFGYGETSGSINVNASSDPINMVHLPVSLKKDKSCRFLSDDQFASRSTNFMPSDVNNAFMFKTAYQSQFLNSHNDIGYKDDERFSWTPGCGSPRRQFRLLEIQDSFIKSQVRKKFHAQFSERNPDLRENIRSGKKHSFGSLNAQVLRGSMLVQ